MQTLVLRPVRSLAAIAAGLALTVLVLEYLVAKPDSDALREFLVTAGLIAIATAIVFGLVIPRALAHGGSPRIALTLSLLGLVLAGVYWSGLPPVLAIGGVTLAQRGTDRDAGGLTRAATIVGLLALLADLAALIADGIVSH